MNGRLGKAKFNWIKIQLYYGNIFSIIIGKHIQKCERKIPIWSVRVHKYTDLTLIIPVK